MLLFSLCLSMLLSALGSSLGNVALPALAQTWRAVCPGAMGGAGLSAHPTALQRQRRALERQPGPPTFALAGIAVFSIGSALCAAAPSLPMLIAARRCKSWARRA